MGKAKRIFMVLAIVTILTTLLTGCSSSSNVITKWDSKEISLYSDYNCFIDLTVEIKDDNISYTSKKVIELSAGEPLKISINDFGVSNFFSDTAEIYNVSIAKSSNETIVIVGIVFASCSLLGSVAFFVKSFLKNSTI